MLDITSEIRRLNDNIGGTVSVAVRNIENADDFSFNDDLIISSASTIKLAMLVEALGKVRDGKLSLETEFTITKDICCGGSGVLKRLHEGMVVTFKDLLTLMIIVSDNTATNILIDALGMDNVNSMLRGFGYTGTALRRKMYDWDAIEQGRDNVIVAREAADLLVKIAGGEAVGAGFDKIAVEILLKQQFTDKLSMFLPEEVQVANKTGEREGIINDCGIVMADGFSYAIAVFTKDVPIPGEARVAIGRISKLVYDTVADRFRASKH